MQIKDIKTIGELEACQKSIRRQIGDEGNAIASSFRNMKEEYSPRNIRLLGRVKSNSESHT